MVQMVGSNSSPNPRASSWYLVRSANGRPAWAWSWVRAIVVVVTPMAAAPEQGNVLSGQSGLFCPCVVMNADAAAIATAPSMTTANSVRSTRWLNQP